MLFLDISKIIKSQIWRSVGNYHKLEVVWCCRNSQGHCDSGFLCGTCEVDISTEYHKFLENSPQGCKRIFDSPILQSPRYINNWVLEQIFCSDS